MENNQSIQGAQGPNPTQARPVQENYKFTPEEMKLLQECNTESFFQRSLPIGTLLGLSTFYGVKAGYLKPHIRWGPTPKVMLAITAGYFIGKISYQATCAEKFMKLPNSRFGEMLRARRTGKKEENIEIGGMGTMALTPFTSLMPTYSDEAPRNYDLDSYRPDMSDAAAIPHDNIMSELVPESVTKTDLKSYEELRQQNRAEYQKSRGVNYRVLESTRPISSELPTDLSAIDSNIRSNTPKPPNVRKNQYGDPID